MRIGTIECGWTLTCSTLRRAAAFGFAAIVGAMTAHAQTGACCLGTACSVVSGASCTGAGGTYQGDGTACTDYYKVPVTGSTPLEIIHTTGTFIGDPTQSPNGFGTAQFGGLQNVPIGFTFQYYGTPITTVTISKNGGWIKLGQPASPSDPSNYGSSSFPYVPQSGCPSCNFGNDVSMVEPLAGYMNPIAIPLGGGVFYQMKGTAPYRRFIVEWNQISDNDNSGQITNPNTFEVILYESSDAIEFRYGTFSSGTIGHFTGINDPNNTAAGLAGHGFNYTAVPNTSMYIAPTSGPCAARTYPTGACCNGTACSVGTQAACEGAGYFYPGDGSSCAASPCATPFVGCCTPDGNCTSISSSACTAAGGLSNQACTPNYACSLTLSACCTGSNCTITAQSKCSGTWSVLNGTFTPNIACLPTSCDPYCITGANNCGPVHEERIGRVVFNTIDNNVGFGPGPLGCYTNYSKTNSTNIIRGQTYAITVYNPGDHTDCKSCGQATNGDLAGVWFDWNQDHVLNPLDPFDPSTPEEIDLAGGPYIFTGTVTVPLNAVLGQTRMRVRVQNAADLLDPCAIVGNGSTQDYSVVIQAAPTGTAGACCLPGQGCISWDQTNCTLASGVFGGNGTTCGSVTCPALGNCCVGTNCTISYQSTCSGTGTSWGAGQTCSSRPCDYCYSHSVMGNVSLPSPVINTMQFLGVNYTESANETYWGYDNLTALPGMNMTVGTGGTITVTVNSHAVYGTLRCTVFVDWNHNNVLSDSGEIYRLNANSDPNFDGAPINATTGVQINAFDNTPHSGTFTFSGAITPPSGALTGATRLRISLGDWGQYVFTPYYPDPASSVDPAPPSPCGSYLAGQVQDYTLTLSAAAGTCCKGSTCVTGVAASACTGANTAYIAGGSTCNASGNRKSPCCEADFNHSGSITVQDIFDFLAAWFAHNPIANITSNGSGAPTVQSIFDFLAAWFAKGC